MLNNGRLFEKTPSYEATQIQESYEVANRASPNSDQDKLKAQVFEEYCIVMQIEHDRETFYREWVRERIMEFVTVARWHELCLQGTQEEREMFRSLQLTKDQQELEFKLRRQEPKFLEEIEVFREEL